MTDNSYGDGFMPTTKQELHEEIEATRAELGETVEDLVAKTDVKRRVKDKTAAVAHQAVDKTAEAKDQIEEKAAEVVSFAKDKTPDAVQERGAEVKDHLTGAAGAVAGTVHDKTPDAVAEKVNAATQAARRHRPEILAAALAGVAALLVARRSRRNP